MLMLREKRPPRRERECGVAANRSSGGGKRGGGEEAKCQPSISHSVVAPKGAGGLFGAFVRGYTMQVICLIHGRKALGKDSSF